MKKNDIEKIKILLVDDHPLMREGIKKVLHKTDDIEVVSEASTASEAIECLNKKKPDAAVVDIMLKGNVNGLELTKSICERFPDVRVLVLSMHDESIYAERAIRAGSLGYIMKDAAPRHIAHALRTVMKDEIYLGEGLSKQIIGKLLRGSVDTEGMYIDSLTDREFEVFQLVGNGFSTKEIAKKLNLSIYTVEGHKKNIRKKMNLKNSSDLTKHAIQWVIMQSR